MDAVTRKSLSAAMLIAAVVVAFLGMVFIVVDELMRVPVTFFPDLCINLVALILAALGCWLGRHRYRWVARYEAVLMDGLQMAEDTDGAPLEVVGAFVEPDLSGNALRPYRRMLVLERWTRQVQTAKAPGGWVDVQ